MQQQVTDTFPTIELKVTLEKLLHLTFLLFYVAPYVKMYPKLWPILPSSQGSDVPLCQR